MLLGIQVESMGRLLDLIPALPAHMTRGQTGQTGQRTSGDPQPSASRDSDSTELKSATLVHVCTSLLWVQEGRGFTDGETEAGKSQSQQEPDEGGFGCCSVGQGEGPQVTRRRFQPLSFLAPALPAPPPPRVRPAVAPSCREMQAGRG